MLHDPWFILPPGEAHYYQFRSPTYQSIPSFMKQCSVLQDKGTPIMELIYPNTHKQIFVPIELSGLSGKTVFKAAHQNSAAIVYWHLDDQYLGSTQTFHELALRPTTGSHVLTLVDDQGFQIEQDFEVVN
jgi:penicillin-binding protein 1C